MRMAEVRLETYDVPRLADFYKRLLGIDNGSVDEKYQVLIHEGTVFSIAYKEYWRHYQNVTLSIEVEDDIDAVAQKALRLGARVYNRLEREPGGTISLRIEDPDHNTVYLRSTETEVREVQ